MRQERVGTAAGRRTLAVCAAALLGVIGTGSAAAAVSPQRIYEDLADNGRLDGRYTDADIARALDPEQILGTDARPPTVRRPTVTPARPSDSRESSPGGRLPFTGLDLALFVAGGGPLLLVAFALKRRLAAPSATGVEAVRS
jgi:hypothetical protein